MVPPVSAQRPASIPTDVLPPGPVGPASRPPGAPRATSQPPVIGTPAPGQVRASAQQGAVSRAPNGPKSKPGSEQVPESIRRRASERLNSGGQPGLTAGSVIAPAPRKVPWILIAIDLAMIIAGVLFIRAALAKADAGTTAGDPAGSGSASGSAMTSVEPITSGSGSQTTPVQGAGSGTSATTALRPPTGGGTSGGTLRPPTGSGGLLHPPTGSGSATTPPTGSASGSSTTPPAGSGSGAHDPGTGGHGSDNHGSGSTIDPYPPDAAPTGDDDKNAADLATQVNRLSSRSQTKFDHCYVTATKSLPPEQALTGDIDIAFQILGTGEIRNAAVVSDTTGSAELGRCLLAVISTWQFTASGGGPTDFVRPFHFSGH